MSSNETDQTSEWRSIRAIVATTHPVRSYGFRFSKEVLEQLARDLPTIPMTLNHDARRPVRVRNLMATVRKRDDGEYEVVAEYEAFADANWESYQRELADLGITGGGFSITFGEPLGRVGSSDGEPSAILGADVRYFSDDDILAAGRELSSRSPVDVVRVYQLAADPLALVSLVLLKDFVLAIPPGVLSSWLYDALHRFVRPGQRPSVFNFKIQEDPHGERECIGYLPTGDREVLKHALDTFENVARGRGVVEFDAGTSDWRQVVSPEAED